MGCINEKGVENMLLAQDLEEAHAFFIIVFICFYFRIWVFKRNCSVCKQNAFGPLVCGLSEKSEGGKGRKSPSQLTTPSDPYLPHLSCLASLETAAPHRKSPLAMA